MSLPDTYSRRTNPTATDVFTYELPPKNVRVQTVLILGSGLGNQSKTEWCYRGLVDMMREELGVHTLAGSGHLKPIHEFYTWLEDPDSLDHWLSAVELALRIVDNWVRKHWSTVIHGIKSKPDDTIARWNGRMREASIGYQYASGDIVRVDSLHMHQEVMLPALALLTDPMFSVPEAEFHDAHKAFREGRHEDCLGGCLKAFESVLKIIGARRNWPIKDDFNASQLIKAAVDAGFFASLFAASLNHLTGLLMASTPALRNKLGSHGAGTTPRVVAEHVAAYQLNQTAASILFFAEQNASQP